MAIIYLTNQTLRVGWGYVGNVTAQRLCKVLCHNICCVISAIYELGIEPVFALA